MQLRAFSISMWNLDVLITFLNFAKQMSNVRPWTIIAAAGMYQLFVHSYVWLYADQVISAWLNYGVNAADHYKAYTNQSWFY